MENSEERFEKNINSVLMKSSFDESNRSARVH